MSSKTNNSNEWGNNLSFIFAMIGAAVGLGNIWRFPYVLYSCGGGAFYIPYLTAVLILGIPFLILEYTIGYNFKASYAKGLRKINKKFEFMGWLLPVCIFLIAIYYIVIIGWILIYVVLSFYKGWGDNTDDFYENKVLQASTDPSSIFHFVPFIALSTLICWLFVWIVSHRQLEKGVGRFSKILVPLLFIIMIIIVIYSLTLDGASIGLNVLFKPDWSLLKNFSIWTSAFGQVLFSLSLGYSEAYTYASYSGNDTDLITNAIITSVANCAFENFCALGVFSVLGYMAKIQATNINEIVSQGTGLVFVAYPAILNVLGKFGYILGPAFFLTVLFAGLTSMLCMIEPFSFNIQNKFDWSRKKTATVEIVAGAILSMIFATGYGNELLGHIDNFLNNVIVLIGIAFECYIYAWAFDIKRAIRTLNARSKSITLGKIWLSIVRVILPLIIVVIWVGSLIDMFKSGNVTQITIYGISMVITFGLTALFTFKKSTSDTYDEVEDRL